MPLGLPYATIMDEGLKASFCNFRYKQSWLDKKKYVHDTNVGNIGQVPVNEQFSLDKKGGERG